MDNETFLKVMEILAKMQYEIEKLEKKIDDMAEKWIPCSERLPARNGDYLVTRQSSYSRVVHTLGYSATDKKWGYGGVIAWQEYPKPYLGKAEQPEGRWIVDVPAQYADGAKCSVCGALVYGALSLDECPKCKAKMKKEGDAD